MPAYPYASAFNNYLHERGNAERTIVAYNSAIQRFFSYVDQESSAYKATGAVTMLTKSDVQSYLNSLITNQLILPTTYNKHLSILNNYFSYLFKARLVRIIPTIDLKAIPVDKHTAYPADGWVDHLDEYLKNEKLLPYTRMTLLLISKGFRPNDIIASGFYRKMAQVPFTSKEKVFLSSFHKFVRPLQEKMGTHDIFVKQRKRGNSEALLSLQGLFHYLEIDETVLGFPLNPGGLRRSLILSVVLQHKFTDDEIMSKFHIDETNLRYYLFRAYSWLSSK